MVEDAPTPSEGSRAPSHREDGTPFTHCAVLANSENTENRCCDDCVCNDDYTACMGLLYYHTIMSIVETGSVLKTTDFDVHRFIDCQHFINHLTPRICEPAVVHKAWKLVARRPNAKASGTNSPTATTLKPLGRSASLLIIKILSLVLHKLRCERSLETMYLAAARARLRLTPITAVCSCRRANMFCGKWCRKGIRIYTRCGNLADAKLEAAQKEEYARQQTETLVVEQRLQQLTDVLHQSQVETAERAERAARELRPEQEQQYLRFWPSPSQQHPQFTQDQHFSPSPAQQQPHFARQPLQPPSRTQEQQHLQLGPADFIPAPTHTRIRQRTGQHPLGWQWRRGRR